MSKRHPVSLSEEALADLGYIGHYLAQIKNYSESTYAQVQIGSEAHKAHIDRAIELQKKVFAHLKLQTTKGGGVK